MIKQLEDYLALVEYRLKEPAFVKGQKGIGERHHIIPKSINKRQNVLDLFSKYNTKQVVYVVN